MVDFFVIFDHVQYTKNDWRNRNLIKTSSGVNWLTIGVKQERLGQRIDETKVSWNKWNVKHWKTIKTNYAKAQFFKDYQDLFEELYFSSRSMFLSEINVRFIKEICGILKIETKIISSLEFEQTNDRTGNLVAICEQLGANTYLSGPSAKSYLKTMEFESKGIEVEWMDYKDYPIYRQLHPPFEHRVSILDLILNEGSNATAFMNSFK